MKLRISGPPSSGVPRIESFHLQLMLRMVDMQSDVMPPILPLCMREQKMESRAAEALSSTTQQAVQYALGSWACYTLAPLAWLPGRSAEEVATDTISMKKWRKQEYQHYHLCYAMLWYGMPYMARTVRIRKREPILSDFSFFPVAMSQPVRLHNVKHDQTHSSPPGQAARSRSSMTGSAFSSNLPRTELSVSEAPTLPTCSMITIGFMRHGYHITSFSAC